MVTSCTDANPSRRNRSSSSDRFEKKNFSSTSRSCCFSCRDDNDDNNDDDDDVDNCDGEPIDGDTLQERNVAAVALIAFEWMGGERRNAKDSHSKYRPDVSISIIHRVATG